MIGELGLACLLGNVLDRLESSIEAQMAEKIVADAQAEKAKQDAERKAQQAMIDKAKLEQDFQKDLPEIRNYLTNYLSDGYELRGGGKGPASLRALRGTPTFEPGRRGLEAIIRSTFLPVESPFQMSVGLFVVVEQLRGVCDIKSSLYHDVDGSVLRRFVQPKRRTSSQSQFSISSDQR